MLRFTKLALLLLIIPLLFSACKRDIFEITDPVDTDSDDPVVVEFKKVADYDYTVLNEWFQLWLVLERYADGYRPCPNANALGYVGLANYEATVSGMPQYKSLASYYGMSVPKVFSNQEYHWPTVSNAVYNYLYTRLFPEVAQQYFTRIKLLNDKNERAFIEEVDPEVFTRSKNHGIAVAAAVWDYWRENDPVTFDGYKRPYEKNNWEERVDEPGAWTPTFPGPGEGLFPYWGDGMFLAANDDLKICRPYHDHVGQYSEDPGTYMYLQGAECLDRASTGKTYETQWIAEYWSDDLLDYTMSPPSRWISILDQVCAQDNASLELAIIGAAKVGIALHDAAIGCWGSKYYYNILRPITYIQENMDPDFKTNLNNPITKEYSITPTFPAYPSGHATFAGAASEVMSDVFGYSYSLTDRTHQDRGEFLGYPRNYTSFYQMANENAWSRILLGVHFKMDGEEGINYGTKIGKAVVNLPWKK